MRRRAIISPHIQVVISAILYISSGAIIGDGDRNEVPFTISRASAWEELSGYFSTNYAILTEQIKKRALHANLRSDLDKLTGPRHFQMLVLLKTDEK